MTLEEAIEEIGIDGRALAARMAGNAGLIRRFLLRFPEDGTYSGIKPAMDGNDMKELEFRAHTLKGLAGNLGFEKLYRLCGDMVDRLRRGEKEGLGELYADIEREYSRIVETIKNIDV